MSVTLDGKKTQEDWFLMTGDILDVLNTKAQEIVFMSDIDTLKIELDEWQTRDFDIITDDGKKASVRVKRQSDNVYERPDPELIKRSPSGLLGKKHAEFDIRALVYALSEIHPDMFSVCGQEEFFTLVDNATQTLPDSVSTLELYRRLAPVVAALGDGHTNLGYPYNDVFTDELRQMPFSFKINSDMSAVCSVCIDSIIPAESKILSINGCPMEALIEEMLPYVAGEKKPLRISRLNYDFSDLRLIQHPTDRYEAVYLPEESKEPLTANLEGARIMSLKNGCLAGRK